MPKTFGLPSSFSCPLVLFCLRRDKWSRTTVQICFRSPDQRRKDEGSPVLTTTRGSEPVQERPTLPPMYLSRRTVGRCRAKVMRRDSIMNDSSMGKSRGRFPWPFISFSNFYLLLFLPLFPRKGCFGSNFLYFSSFFFPSSLPPSCRQREWRKSFLTLGRKEGREGGNFTDLVLRTKTESLLFSLSLLPPLLPLLRGPV